MVVKKLLSKHKKLFPLLYELEIIARHYRGHLGDVSPPPTTSVTLLCPWSYVLISHKDQPLPPPLFV